MTEPVEVDLWILECLADPSPREPFVSSSIAIILESCKNVFPLLGSEKPGGCGVIRDEEVSGNREDNGRQAFLERYVNRHIES